MSVADLVDVPGILLEVLSVAFCDSSMRRRHISDAEFGLFLGFIDVVSDGKPELINKIRGTSTFCSLLLEVNKKCTSPFVHTPSQGFRPHHI